MSIVGTVRELQGVIPILPVPFHETGEVDEMGFRRVVNAAIDDGVQGLAIFGLASEYAKLSDKEESRLTAVLIEQAAQRVPVIVSITHHSLEIAVERAKEAERRGADAIMVLPPFFLSPSSEAVEAHIEAIAAALKVPVIVQYAPIQTGTSLTAATIAGIYARCPNVQYVKVDTVPAGPMVTRLQSIGLRSMVGYMGLHLPQDFDRGAVAVMPTVSVSRAFVHLWKMLHSDTERARQFHHRMLPLLNFMMQSVEMLVAIEKVLLSRRGLIASTYCRSPHWKLDNLHSRELDRLCVEHRQWLFTDQLATQGEIR